MDKARDYRLLLLKVGEIDLGSSFGAVAQAAGVTASVEDHPGSGREFGVAGPRTLPPGGPR
jgi:hypothetical protein